MTESFFLQIWQVLTFFSMLYLFRVCGNIIDFKSRGLSVAWKESLTNIRRSSFESEQKITHPIPLLIVTFGGLGLVLPQQKFVLWNFVFFLIAAEIFIIILNANSESITKIELGRRIGLFTNELMLLVPVIVLTIFSVSLNSSIIELAVKAILFLTLLGLMVERSREYRSSRTMSNVLDGTIIVSFSILAGRVILEDVLTYWPSQGGLNFLNYIVFLLISSSLGFLALTLSMARPLGGFESTFRSTWRRTIVLLIIIVILLVLKNKIL